MSRPIRGIAAALAVAVAAGPAPAQILYYAAPSAGVAGVTVAIPVQPVAAPPPAAAPVQPAAVVPVMAVPVMMAPMSPPTPVVRSYYQVKKGGRLETVAKRTGAAYADLVRLNPSLDATGKLPAGTLVGLPIP